MTVRLQQLHWIRQHSSTAWKYFTLYVKVYWRGKKKCWLHVQWDAPTFKCAHSAGCSCRKCLLMQAQTHTHSPEQLCLLHLCKSQQMSMSGVHSHKRRRATPSTFQPPHNNKRPASVCVEVKRDSSRYKIHTQNVQSCAIESKSTLNCRHSEKNKTKKPIGLRLHTYVHTRIWHMCALAECQSEHAWAGLKPLRLCEYLWVSMSHSQTGKTSSHHKVFNCILPPAWAWILNLFHTVHMPCVLGMS